MSWQEIKSYGLPWDEEVINLVALCHDKPGVIEIQARPVTWEYMLRDLGRTRPTTLQTCESKVSFSTGVMGRVVRFYAVDESGLDFRFRVVPQ